MNRQLTELDRQLAWDLLAHDNAMWASCTSGKRRLDWDASAFMRTGAREVAWATAHARDIGVLPAPVERALDFGCGPGRLTGALTTVATQVVGFDPSGVMLELAKANHRESPFVTFAARSADLATASVDLAYSTFVLQHLPYDARRAALAEIARILRPGGLLIFQFPRRPRITPYGLPWHLLPNRLLMWIQEAVYRLPAAMPMYWRAFRLLPTELGERDLRLIDRVQGLTYSPNWIDSWHFAVRTPSASAE